MDTLTTPEVIDLPHHLPAVLFSLSAKIARHAFRHNAQLYGLDMCEWRVILILGAKQESSINEVADSIAMDRGGTSRAIARLEKAGYIDRISDPKDRRRSTVSLSLKGALLHDPIAHFSNQREVSLLSCLTPHEAREMFSALMKLDSKIDQMMEAPIPVLEVA